MDRILVEGISRKNSPGLLLLVMLLAGVCIAGPGDGDPFVVDSDEPDRSPFVAVAEAARPAVVSIRTVRSVTQGDIDLDPMEEMYRRFFPEGAGDPFAQPGSGTGFVATASGHIITNNHVIARADAVSVRFSGDPIDHPATVVGVDPASDLAVLRIDPGICPGPLRFADSDRVRVGDWAVAVGNPFGNLEGSLTVGVVSAKGRSDLVIAGGAPRFQDFLQTDAPINFGNSGGPLLDIEGRVIGVNTAMKAGGQGIGFAIPGNFVRRICGQLISQGRVVRGHLGARTQDREGSAAGALVTAVLPDSPADAAGIVAGDVIVGLGDSQVDGQRDLIFAISDASVGEELDCVVERGGSRLTLTVVLETTAAEAAGAGETWRGLAVADADDDAPRVRRLRESLGIEPEPGAMVLSVDAVSAGAEAGVAAGDVVTAVQGKRIAGRDDFLAAVSAAASGDGIVRLLIRSGGEQKYIDVAQGTSGRVN